MAGFFAFWGDAGRALWGAWTFDTSMAQWFGGHPGALAISAMIAVLAGASTLLGNSVVLFLNRVGGWRFALSLLLNGLGFVVVYLTQAVIVIVVGQLATGRTVPWEVVVRAVMLATAPLVFGFFELVPYLGPGIAKLLQAWGVAALLVIVQVVYATGWWPAIWITGIAWGAMQLVSWALAKPLAALGAWFWRLISGKPVLLRPQDVLSGHQFIPVEFDFQLEPGEVGR